MKNIILATAGAVALVLSFTAFAGPDFYVIEKARAAKHTAVQHQAACNAATMKNDALLPMPIAEAALDYSAVSDSPGGT